MVTGPSCHELQMEPFSVPRPLTASNSGAHPPGASLCPAGRTSENHKGDRGDRENPEQ